MPVDLPAERLHLLALCAILRSFDHERLLSLAGAHADDIAALLTSDLVAPLDPAAPAQVRLAPAVQAELLAHLRATPAAALPPFDEVELHARALDFALQRMSQPADPGQRAELETDCLHHLDALRLLLTERRAWTTLAAHVAAMRAAAPRQPNLLRWLAFYEGYLAIQTQRYAEGEAGLTDLLDQPDLDDALRVQIFNALGHSHWYQTRYDRALDCYQQSYTLACATANLLYQGNTLLNMGNIYNELNNYERALELGKQSLAIFRALGAPAREAYALYAVGLNAMYLGRWHEAQDHFDAAIQRYETLGIAAGLAYLYWSQGFLHHMLGDEARSETAYHHALSIAQSPDCGDPAVVLDTYAQLGLLYETQGRWDAALAAYAHELTLADQLQRDHWRYLNHYRRGAILLRQGQSVAAHDAFAAAIAGIEGLRGSTDDEAIKIGLLGTAQQVYEAMVLLCLDAGRWSDAFDYVERARSRAFLDLLARKDPELYATLDQPVATLADVQATLPPGTLLIEYFTTGVVPRGEHLINQLPPENRRLRDYLTLPAQVVIFAVTRDRCEVYRPALDPNTLQPAPDDPGPGRRLLRERLLNHLYDRLIGPVLHLLPNCDQLYLVPHGPLHYVPFMALRAAGGDYLLAAAGPAIALAPSATILLRNCLSRPPERAATFLALGYNDRDGAGLRYAEAEARHIARLMGGAAWTGPDPKRQRLAEVGPQVRWLHIAGHAVYHPRDPLASELCLGDGETLSARAIIGGLDLRADLVTLSACTSGLSHVVPGDELLGLQRALLYAGAPTVVCTLWEAADLVALLVMERFYLGLQQGRRAAEALRDAQVAVRGMTGRDLAAAIARWQDEDPDFANALDLPEIAPDEYDQAIYADPQCWATFMLIGRPW